MNGRVSHMPTAAQASLSVLFKRDERIYQVFLVRATVSVLPVTKKTAVCFRLIRTMGN